MKKDFSSKKNCAELHELMSRHDATCPDVADILGKAVATIYCWRSPGSDKFIADAELFYLRHKLMERDRKKTA